MLTVNVFCSLDKTATGRLDTRRMGNNEFRAFGNPLSYNQASKGVRCHSLLSAMILQLFGKVIKLQQTFGGKTVYLNINSLINRVAQVERMKNDVIKAEFTKNPSQFIQNYIDTSNF